MCLPPSRWPMRLRHPVRVSLAHQRCVIALVRPLTLDHVTTHLYLPAAAAAAAAAAPAILAATLLDNMD